MLHLTQLTSLALLLSPLGLAAPAHFPTRQTSSCAPASYTITNYQYIKNPSGARIFFNFQSHFSDPSLITDPSISGATCNANAADGVIPNEVECSTGRGNFFFDLRGPQENADFELIHTWVCDGKQWMSPTHHKMESLYCSTGDDGAEQCNAPTNDFPAENVRQICSAPTHC